MAVQTTSTLDYAIRTLYSGQYQIGAQRARIYDMFAAPVSKMGIENAARLGQTVRVSFLSEMAPSTTALSQTADVTPQTVRDYYAEITSTSRGNALQFSEQLAINEYTDFAAKAYGLVGKNMQDSVEILAVATALAGTNVTRAAARASLDAGTSGHRFSDASLVEAEVNLRTLGCPGWEGDNRPSFFAALHTAPYLDLVRGGNIVSIAQYQNGAIILNNELGQFGSFRLLASADAKVFAGAGIDNGTAATDTLSSAATALATTIAVSAGTNFSSGDWLNIGTEETSSTFYPTNERVKYVSGTTTVTIQGSGPNGGLRFDHASGEAVNNNDNVYPVLFGGPSSIAKLFDAPTGEYGTLYGPEISGLLHQFTSFSWKWYGGYGRWVEPWLLRGEYTYSGEA